MLETFSIPTFYNGRWFRSRLEARWAIAFDTLGIAWTYEPDIYVVNGTLYLPDFQLLDCGTWIEVRGAESRIDRKFHIAAAAELPDAHAIAAAGSPSLMILGPIPAVPHHDFGWIALSAPTRPGTVTSIRCAGFGGWPKNRQPWWNYACCPTTDHHAWTRACTDGDASPDTQRAYRIALTTRFDT